MRARTQLAIALCLFARVACADETVRFERGESEVRILVGEQPFARYVFRDDEILRPYFTDVRAPDGTSVTRHHPPREGVDATDHDTMHPGIWLAFGDLNGADFWRNKARVEIDTIEEDADRGSFIVRNRYLDGESVVCEEEQRVTIVPREGAIYLLLDSTFSAGEKGFYFGDQEEMGLGVRVATPLAVANGGRIVNSAGQRNEAECWGKTALWADYGGTIDGKRAGIVLMPHPENFRPSWFHARDYGFIAANPFGQKAFTAGEPSRIEVKPGDTFRVQYGVCVYTGERGGAQAYSEYQKLIGEVAPAESAEASEEIRRALEEIVAARKIPGMVAAIADSRGVIATGAAGVLKAGAEPKLTADDLVHIGSCTKAMTSTVLATLVAEGALRWDSTLIEVIPALKDAIHPDYHTVTLWELVSHRARFPANAQNWWAHATMELKARRLEHLKDNLREAPVPPVGGYLYSNLGYVAAGCMAEAVTGETWETLIRARLFEPLGMTSAGFGPPGTPGQTDQPWGHIKEGNDWRPMQFDNPEALGPAGRVHCTPADWAKFAALQLPSRAPRILDRPQLDRLIVPTGDYAAGWGVVQREWAGGTALTHMGSNTLWFAIVWVAPATDRVYLVAMNAGGDEAAAICDGAIGRLIAIDRKFSTTE